jgi:NitT/TauT family transport system permease protein
MNQLESLTASVPVAGTPEIIPRPIRSARDQAPPNWAQFVVPLAMVVATLIIWEAAIRVFHVPAYILPGPVAIGRALVADWTLLSHALGVTLQVTALALVAAVVFGVLLALVMSQSAWLELMLFPYMVVMQVTPIIAIAPLIIIWVNNLKVGLLMCAWLIAFFPIVSNTVTGLKSTDRHLEDLFQLYGASRWQMLWELRLPAAMPFFLAGLRISGGLSLIGAIAAEFVAGTGGQGSGLAFQILQAGYQMNMPRLFAALALISLAGLGIHLFLSTLSHLVLRRWHESALRREL